MTLKRDKTEGTIAVDQRRGGKIWVAPASISTERSADAAAEPCIWAETPDDTDDGGDDGSHDGPGNLDFLDQPYPNDE